MRFGRDVLILVFTLCLVAAGQLDDPFGKSSHHTATPKQPAAPPAEISHASLTRLQTALFEVRSKSGSAPAILLTKSGLAVTSFHAVRGAASAVGVFAADPNRAVPLELWGVQPRLDLAIVQIVPKNAEDLPILFGHVEIEESTPVRNDRVWSPEFTETGFVATNGVVIATQETRAAPRDIQQRFIQHATWIQTDCPVSTTNGGGPLVNAQGKLVGINVWRWDRGTSSNSYYALGVGPVKELLATLPKEPLTFAGAAAKFGRAPGPRITFPDLPITRDRPATPIATQAASMANSGICETCQGKGFIFRQVVVGASGTFIKSSVYKDAKETCPVCKGAKFNAIALRNLRPKMVEAFARAKPGDPDFERSCAQAVVSLRKLLAVDPVQLQRMLASDSESEASKEGSAVGVPVMGVSASLEEVHFPGETIRYKMIKSGTTFFILRDPVFSEATPGPKTVALFGGVETGDVERYDGVSVHVLKNGFLIGTP